MSPRAVPRPRSLVLRLVVLVTAAALAVFLQAGAGASSGDPASMPAGRALRAPPAEAVECASPAGPEAALNHPALASVPQPSAAASSRSSNGCSREARAGS